MRKTIIVSGVIHSGTTMVAGVLQILGVPMVGEWFRPTALEDSDVYKNFQIRKDFEPVVKARNEKHKVWGFKVPEIDFAHANILELCPNPHFIIMFRCPYGATIKSHAMNASGEMPMVIHKSERMIFNANRVIALREQGLPVMKTSYEKAILDKEKFLNELIYFCGLEPTLEQYCWAANHIQPGVGNKRNLREVLPPWTSNRPSFSTP